MRRAVRISLILFALGVLTSAFSAWVCCVVVNTEQRGTGDNRYRNDTPPPGESTRPYSEWSVVHRHFVGMQKVTSNWIDRQAGVEPRITTTPQHPEEVLPHWFDAYRPGSFSGPAGRHTRLGTAFGWPTVSMWYLVEGDSEGDAYPMLLPDDLSIELWKVTRVLPHATVRVTLRAPLRPIWSGLAIGGVFWAIVLWLPMYGLMLLGLRWRGRRRLRRRRCPRCKYDLTGGGHKQCPECGEDTENDDSPA